MKKCKMVSLDTSSTISGYAYWENGVLKESGIFYHKDEGDELVRREDMCIDILQYLNQKKPDIVVIEQPPFCKGNPSTLRLLSEIVGSVLGWSLCSGYTEFVEYNVSRWRKLIAGKDEKVPRKTKEAKAWDMKKAEPLISKVLEDDNEADAILIGLARIKEIDRYSKGERKT